MAREFTPKEARDLLKQYQSLGAGVTYISQFSAKYEKEATSSIYNLIDTHTLENIIRDEVVNGNDALPRESELFDLVSAIYKYIELTPRIKTCKESYDTLDAYYSSVEKDLELGTKSNLQWMFLSGEKKNLATKAYTRLQKALDGEIVKDIKHTISIIEDSSSITPEEIWYDFDHNRPKYRTALLNIVPNALNRGANITEISDLSARKRTLERDLGYVIDVFNNSEKDILKAVNLYLGQEAFTVLKDVPVEELSKDRAGLRVKALHDYGFHNLSDIYAATTSNISQVRGISWETAYAVKQYAIDYLKKAQESVKIRLSADNRTSQSSKIVLEIYKYKQRLHYIESAEKMLPHVRNSNKNSEKNLGYIGNGTNWIFFTPQQKELLRESYNIFSRFLDTYEAKARTLTSNFNEISRIQEIEAWNDFKADPISYYNILERIAPEYLGNNDSIYGLPEDLAREIQDQDFFPDGLNCELRRYQEWGVKYILHQEKALLGDEMGLGKTVQAIATMVSLRNTGAKHFMVVCPASVLPNWCKEISQKSKLRVTKIHGPGRWTALKDWIRAGGAAVTTYETVGSLDLNPDFKFSLLVVDEAHYIKNPAAKRTKCVKTIGAHAERMLFMTGTALENTVSEMISLIDMLQPPVARAVEPLAFMASAPQFREKVAPVYYRRKREDVLTELPELIETKEWCELTKEEERLYEKALYSKNQAMIRRVSWNVDDLNHSSKALRMKELISDAEEDGRKVIVFSFYLDTIRKIREFLGRRCWGPINGSVPPETRQDIINSFEDAPDGSVLLAQIQAGGTGLNIQSASVVIICEPQFKPSIENQAISRAYRMGQARNVLVYRLLCEESVDERLTERLAQKQAEFDAFADKSVAADMTIKQEAAIDDKTFGKIIEEEIERINAKKAAAKSDDTDEEETMEK